jgi:hypothetical protein
MTFRKHAKFLAGIVLLAGLLSSSSAVATDSVASGSSSVERSKARRLHDLSGKILPKLEQARRREDLRALRAALETLAAQLDTTQSDPSAVQLHALRKHLRGAQSAFALVRGRLPSAGGAELATDLEEKFQLLWDDVDGALASSSRRRERLAAARARVEAAIARRSDRHGSGVTVLPLGGWE